MAHDDRAQDQLQLTSLRTLRRGHAEGEVRDSRHPRGYVTVTIGGLENLEFKS